MLADLPQPLLCVAVQGRGGQGKLSDLFVHERLVKWLLSDDVVTTEFLRTVLLFEVSACKTGSAVGGDSRWNRQPLDDWPLLRELGTEQIVTTQVDTSLVSIRSGPYIISGSKFHSVFRVYEDSQGAFFPPFNEIPVTRMYHLSRSDQLPTSRCHRAFAMMKSPRNSYQI